MKIFRSSLLILFILALALSLAGCNSNTGGKQVDSNSLNTNSDGQNTKPASFNYHQSSEGSSGQKVKLYFSDDQAMYLVPEERIIVPSDSNKEAFLKKVVEELIKGPTQNSLALTIPKETKVHSVKLASDGTATVDFSQEIKTKNFGGSTGESFAVYSLVDTLTDFPDIIRVQILIDGQKVDTLTGHLDTSQPFVRDNTLIKK